MGAPLVSIIMPCFNGNDTIERAIKSVTVQSLEHWELLVVDDCSTDSSHESVMALSHSDDRIRLFRTHRNSGPSTARNVGLANATGRMIAYLDCDDEYYPDYLQNVHHFSGMGDVLIFCYDRREFDVRTQQWRTKTLNPECVAKKLFEHNVAAIFGVAHKRILVRDIGMFNEGLWFLEDWDYWRRLARAGAEFIYVPLKSGVYHIREGSLSQGTVALEKQRALLEANLNHGGPGHGGILPSPATLNVRRVAFLSSEAIIDSSNPEAEARTNSLNLISQLGVDCQVFCLARAAGLSTASFEQDLEKHDMAYQTTSALLGRRRGHLVFTRVLGIPVTLFIDPSMDNSSIEAFVSFCEQFLVTYQPDIVLLDGIDNLSCWLAVLCKRRDLPVLLWHEGLCDSPHGIFENIDYCIVPTEFSKRFHWDAVGLACDVLPPVVRARRMRDRRLDPRLLCVFEETELSGGLNVADCIRQTLKDRRPDIPVLAERHNADMMPSAEVECGSVPSPTAIRGSRGQLSAKSSSAMANIVVLPSAVPRAFSTIVVEAMVNGVPVIASDVGANSELIGKGGLLLPAVAAVGGTSSAIAETILERWVDAIVTLWDDPDHYACISGNAVCQSECWSTDRLLPIYRDFVRGIRRQPIPPYFPVGS